LKGVVIAFVVFAFVFPMLAPAISGKLCEFILDLGKCW